MTMEILDGRRDVGGGYKVDASRGQRVSRVSSEWFSRPADERFLSLSELFASVRGRTERSRTRTVESAAIRVEARRDKSDRLALMLPGSETSVAPTHWSFGQLAALVGAPAAYLRQLPAPLAAINLMVWTAPPNGIAMCHVGVVATNRIHMQITTLGTDLAKSVFQLHGIDDAGTVLLRKKVRRQALLSFLAGPPPCLIGMEACATAHFWAREIAALGHEVRLIPPAYVKPYVKRQKNDMADAEAICEAVVRPNMHFVAIKNAEQQAVLMLHRSRELLVRHRIAMINALRTHLAEFGIFAARGAHKMRDLVGVLQSDENDIPAVGRTALQALVRQLDALETEIASFDREIHTWHRQSDISRRLATIPGVGVITATARHKIGIANLGRTPKMQEHLK
jgi:hypothetical protein